MKNILHCNIFIDKCKNVFIISSPIKKIRKEDLLMDNKENAKK